MANNRESVGGSALMMKVAGSSGGGGGRKSTHGALAHLRADMYLLPIITIIAAQSEIGSIVITITR